MLKIWMKSVPCFLSAICAKITPETMISFAANVVCGFVFKYHHTHIYNVVCDMPYFVLPLGKCKCIEYFEVKYIVIIVLNNFVLPKNQSK